MSELLTLANDNWIGIGAVVLAAAAATGWQVYRVLTSRGSAGASWSKFSRSVSLAVKSLWLHKLRSFLSVLCIIIGTSAVISLMAFGEWSLQDEVADKLFPFEDPVGQTVQMKGHFFVIVGVIRERMPTGGTGGSQAAEDYNRDVYIPIKTSRKRFGDVIFTRSSGSRSAERVDVSQVTMTVNAEVDSPAGRKKVQAVGDEIKRILEREHPKKDWAATVPLD